MEILIGNAKLSKIMKVFRHGTVCVCVCVGVCVRVCVRAWVCVCVITV